MAKKTTVQKLKDMVSRDATVKKQKASSASLMAQKAPSTECDNFVTGVKAKSKSSCFDPESALGKLEKQLKIKGLTLKVEHETRLNITVSKETHDHTTQFSTQVNGNFTKNSADVVYAQAVSELLG